MLTQLIFALAALQESDAVAAPEDTGAMHAFETDELRKPSFETGGSFLIVGATIHDALQPAFRGDILVTDGVIAAIGGGLEAPEGVQIVEGSGRHVVPGAIDAHSHMAISGGVNEATLSITADCDMTDVVDAEDIALYRALAGGTTTIQILHGSANAIGGQAELLKLRGRGKTADEIRFEAGPKGIKFALGENPKRSNWGTPGERFPATRLGVEAIFYRAFERANEFRAELEAYDAAVARGEDPAPVRSDLRLEALAAIIEGELIVHAHSYRADEILMLLRAAEAFDFRIGTLHHVLEGYKVASEIAAHGAGTSTFSDWWSYKIEAYDAVPGNAALLDEAGVVSSIKSDSDELVRHLYHEAAKSVGYVGMDRVRALQLVTLAPAIQLGVRDRVGTLEVGKDADIVVFDGDPLDVDSIPQMTFVEGELVFERRDAFELASNPPVVATVEAHTGELNAIDARGGAPFAILGATVHTGVEESIEAGAVIVHNGRIVAIENNLDGFSGEAIDGGGMHLYPGLIALDTEIGLAEIGSIRATQDARELGGGQPDLSVASSINAESAHVGVTRYNGVTRAQAVPRGRPISGQSAVIALAGDTWEEMLTLERDMLHLRFPTTSNLAEEKQRKGISKARRVLAEEFEAAREYSRLREEAFANGLPTPPFDPRAAALAPFAKGDKRVACHANNAQTILHALHFIETQELDAVIYGGAEAWKVAEQLAEAQIPVVIGPILSLPSDRFDPYDAPYAAPAVLARAGVPFAISTANDENPRNLAFHAGFARAYGLPELEALRAVTLYPARILGLEDELGTIEVGKRADLVLADGDLMDPTTRVQRVWIDGVDVDLANRHTDLYDKYAERLAGMGQPTQAASSGR